MFTCNLLQEDGTEMDVDAAAPTTQISIKHGLPEIEIYCYLLVLIFLIDQNKYDEVNRGPLIFLMFDLWNMIIDVLHLYKG